MAVEDLGKTGVSLGVKLKAHMQLQFLSLIVTLDYLIPFYERIGYKLMSLAYKVLTTSQPDYLSSIQGASLHNSPPALFISLIT